MARRKGGIRGVVARVEANTHATLNQAQRSVLTVEDLVRGLIEDLRDGVAFKLEVGGKMLPVKLWMVPSEEELAGKP